MSIPKTFLRSTAPALVALAVTLALDAPLAAQEARVQVRAVASGAKLIGDVVGGARITVTDAESGAVLAEGVTSGGTGDTDLIMRTPREPGGTVFDTPGAAGWLAAFEIDRPTAVTIAAEGPLDYPQATVRSSRTMALAPGAEILGEGIVLTLNGLIVEVLEPGEGTAAASVPVRARVRMLCSCPTEPAGLWSVESVTARLLADGEVLAEAPLEYAGETSVYSGEVSAPGPGAYTLEVLAADPASASYGTGRVGIEVR